MAEAPSAILGIVADPRHFVDATEELSGEVIFAPLAAGQMSLGTRLTLEDWYKGCASELRIHARAVPAEGLGHD